MRVPAFLAVPAVTVILGVATMTVGSGSGRLIAVRVWGGATEAAGPRALRLECVRRAVGVDDRVPLDDLDVVVGAVSRRVACDARGSADLTVDAPAGPLPVTVTRHGQVLAEGVADVSRATWLARAVTISPRLSAAGARSIRGFLEAGVAPMERWTSLLLEVPDDLARPGAIKLSGSGADVQPPTLTPRGFRTAVRPTFVTATVSLEASGGVTWEARLPVAATSLVAEDLLLDDAHLRATVRSLPPREVAYVRVHDQRGRIAAATLPLKSDARGGSFGVLELPLPPLVPPAFLVLGGDPDASGSTAASVPIPPGDITREAQLVPDVRWVDGLGPMRARDLARAAKRAQAVGAMVAAAALLETLLLVDRGRRARRKLREHLAAFEEGAAMAGVEERGGVFAIVLGAAAVLFGFAVLGVLFLARMG